MAEGIGAGVKEGTADQIEKWIEKKRTEAGPIVEERGAGERREAVPGDGKRVEEDGRDERRVRGK